MFRKYVKLRTIGVKFISTNLPKRSTEALNVARKDEYYKNLTEEKSDVKPPGWDEALPFESIPGPKPLPIIGNLFRFLPFIGEYYNVPIRQLYQSLKDKYGSIVSLRGLGREPILILFEVTDMEKHLRNAGPVPIRVGLESLTHYRTVTRKDIFQDVPGVLTTNGEEWFRIRSVINPILMQPRTAQQYVGSIDQVANELIENIRCFSKQRENKEMPKDFQHELYKWALESVGVIALDKHLGCLNLNASKDSESQKLISSVNEIFDLTYTLDILPPIWKYIETPSWKRYKNVSNFITETVQKYIEECLNKNLSENTPEHELSVIQRLVKRDKRVAIAMVMDMFLAGIDTTGKTMAAALYFLAKNPDKQQRLREEVLKNLPEKKSPVTKETLTNSPYLKAVIKETTRIAPIAIGTVRSTIKDSVLSGYQIPKNTEVLAMHIITSNSEHFKDHEKFVPERWLRTTEGEYSYKNVNPFAFLPFGHGARSCIGKRLANLELEVAISKVIRNFELSWHHDDMVFSGVFLYGVDRPLQIKVKELK